MKSKEGMCWLCKKVGRESPVRNRCDVEGGREGTACLLRGSAALARKCVLCVCKEGVCKPGKVGTQAKKFGFWILLEQQ